MPIGAYPSQTLGNFVTGRMDHIIKEGNCKCKCYLKYCDDATGLARTKADAWRMVNNYMEESKKLGLVVKHGIIVAPIGRNGRNGKHRKRQRSHTKRKEH